MPNYRYHLVNVFADRPFAGHPLAVFPEANGLSAGDMQRVATELNLCQTVFCMDPQEPDADTRMRIFTRAEEVSMAGHPVVGAHYILAATGRFPLQKDGGTVAVELNGGVLPVDILCENGKLRAVLWGTNPPSFSEPVQNRDQIAEALDLPHNAIGPGELPVLIVDTGLPWLLIPIHDLRRLRGLTPIPELCFQLAQVMGTERFFAFTQETRDPSCAVRARNISFAGYPPAEDPAAGSDAAALAAYLTYQGVLLAAPTATVVIEQGGGNGRLGRVRALVDVRDRKITRVRVGGRAVHIGDGTLYLP